MEYATTGDRSTWRAIDTAGVGVQRHDEDTGALASKPRVGGGRRRDYLSSNRFPSPSTG
jgi:hypothetical protein